jgi:purine-binding chemotaxis protein CheW
MTSALYETQTAERRIPEGQIGQPPGGQLDENGGTQVLTFVLDGEEYGVDILRVQEIKGWDRVTPIPNTVECVRGVINLRGTVVPIIDLRLRFLKPAIEYSKTTVVIVLKVHAPRGERIVGLVVDAVSDVHGIAASQMREAPELGGGSASRFVRGLATVGEKLVILLDIDQLVLSTFEASEAKSIPTALEGEPAEKTR